MVPMPSAEPIMKRVFGVGPMPPEACAYALARYSRSPDSISASIDWVRTHDSSKFLESFYFQYGHASIADLGHLVLCFENISELAATELEDENLWDGQARSSRYQDFSQRSCIVPPEFDRDEAARYLAATRALIDAYRNVHQEMFEFLKRKHPKPDEMKQDAYERNLKARAFDVARYLLPFGIPTGVGQVTSIRTLERQISRVRASQYGELRELGNEAAAACARPPDVVWVPDSAEPALAPTLAKYVEEDRFSIASTAALRQWAQQHVTKVDGCEPELELTRIEDQEAGIVANLLFPVTRMSYRHLYKMAVGWSNTQRRDVIQAGLAGRERYSDLPRAFRTAPYAFDMVCDIGAYRDMHRHRRCTHFRQTYWQPNLGFAIPPQVAQASCGHVYSRAMESALDLVRELPEPGSHYLLPFGARGRFLMLMDFSEAEYIARLRSGVKGHFSYRRIAWLMKEALAKEEPHLAHLLSATDPAVEDPLTR